MRNIYDINIRHSQQSILLLVKCKTFNETTILCRDEKIIFHNDVRNSVIVRYMLKMCDVCHTSVRKFVKRL
jgi:hypothetical protein